MRVPAEQIRAQLVSVLRAWGMSDAHAETTAAMMLETDLRGVDSHGISMLPTYDREFRAGRLNMRPTFKTLREGPSMALIDADASLGHPVSVQAMNLAGFQFPPNDRFDVTDKVGDSRVYEKTGRTGSMIFVVIRYTLTNQRRETVAVVDNRFMHR